ncbi:50S ribosome-binding protein YggL [Paraglaciecola sp. 25GB23A]|uniref:YggL 50S ribosome-binding family protein n=1 Tax=Paraglaciecola sp. 25GB23A TaxID=3156068 RepID=UPI0032AFCF42
MSEKITRNRRLRKKLHLEEFAILGFEFSFTLASLNGDDYEQFFTSFAAFADSQNLYITLGNDGELFEGSVTSAERYGNATDEDRAAMEALLTSHAIVTDVKVGTLVDACYAM